MMRVLTSVLWFLAICLSAPHAQAQDRFWVQIEAQPSLAEAETRARAWSAVFPDVQGYSLRDGEWYGLMLGPYDRAGAEERQFQLLAENLIPGDSFLTDDAEFGQQFWPVGAVALPDPAPTEEPAAEAAPEAPEVAAPAPDETPDEARASEALLTQAEREGLQEALKWFGFYGATVDGAFGRGTRASMAAWQEAKGHEPTGILTTAQRAELVAAYQDEQAAFGFETITEPEAGIEITYPAAMLQFDHYEPPFVHFTAKDGSDLRMVLISTPGDRATLTGLYDMLQTLEIMPADGPRSLSEDSFTLRGESADRVAEAEVGVSRGLVKGWLLAWDRSDARMDRVVQTLRASFRGVGDRALDPGLVPLEESARQGLLSGLELRKPRLSRSGFYVDAKGTVLTAAEAVAQCGRITLDGTVDATVTLADPATGLAVLSPARPLSPPAVAGFQLAPDRIGAEVAVSGYSYEDRLSAPVLTFGTLADSAGLAGETGVKRLALAALPGDAGGPVLDGTGAVLGMLLPRAEGGARLLPDDVALAVTGATIAATLAPKGITLAEAVTEGAMAPEDLARRAARMTVLVSCWD